MLWDWLLVTEAYAPELRPRDRRIVSALRISLGLAPILSGALLVAPVLTGDRALAEDAAGFLLTVLVVTVPWWVAPMAVWQTGALHRKGDRITAYTLRDRRVLDLARVRRVWARRAWGRGRDGLIAGLSGPEVPTLWVSWCEPGRETSDRVERLVRNVVVRPAVTVSPRAKAELGLPGAPTGQALLLLRLRGALLPLAMAAGVLGVVVVYLMLLGPA